MYDLKLTGVELEYVVAALLVQKIDFYGEVANCVRTSRKDFNLLISNVASIRELIKKIKKQLPQDAILRLDKMEKVVIENYEGGHLAKAIKFTEVFIDETFDKIKKEHMTCSL